MAMKDQLTRMEDGIKDLGTRMSRVEGHIETVAHQTERTGDLLEEDLRWRRARAERLDAAEEARTKVKYKALGEIWRTVKTPLIVILTALAAFSAAQLTGGVTADEPAADEATEADAD